MASACVNNISMPPETFPAATYPSYGWLSPRISFSREFPDDDGSTSKSAVTKHQPPPPAPPLLDLEPAVGDFEFRLENPVAMLPADELFSDGKLVPLHLSSLKPSAGASMATMIDARDGEKSRRRAEMSSVDPYIFSPKAPRCSSRWRELLGLKKLYQNTTTNSNNNKNSESLKTTPFSSSSSASGSGSSKALKSLLHRSSKSSSSSSSDGSLSLPLLKDSDSESVSISSSRLSLSSSTSSGHEHDDLPRLSLDSDKTAPNPFKAPNPNPPRMRLVKPSATNTRVGRSPMRRTTTASSAAAADSAAAVADSPRMNSSGKIIFQSLERSSSSPSSFNGGPRFKHRGMERSYSANVRITPVLNVPVCSLRGSSKSGSVFGFGQLFSSPQKKDSTRTHHHHHHHQNHPQQSSNSSRNRTDRT